MFGFWSKVIPAQVYQESTRLGPPSLQGRPFPPPRCPATGDSDRHVDGKSMKTWRDVFFSCINLNQLITFYLNHQLLSLHVIPSNRSSNLKCLWYSSFWLPEFVLSCHIFVISFPFGAIPHPKLTSINRKSTGGRSCRSEAPPGWLALVALLSMAVQFPSALMNVRGICAYPRIAKRFIVILSDLLSATLTHKKHNQHNHDRTDHAKNLPGHAFFRENRNETQADNFHLSPKNSNVETPDKKYIPRPTDYSTTENHGGDHNPLN